MPGKWTIEKCHSFQKSKMENKNNIGHTSILASGRSIRALLSQKQRFLRKALGCQKYVDGLWTAYIYTVG